MPTTRTRRNTGCEFYGKAKLMNSGDDNMHRINVKARYEIQNGDDHIAVCASHLGEMLTQVAVWYADGWVPVRELPVDPE